MVQSIIVRELWQKEPKTAQHMSVLQEKQDCRSWMLFLTWGLDFSHFMVENHIKETHL